MGQSPPTQIQTTMASIDEGNVRFRNVGIQQEYCSKKLQNINQHYVFSQILDNAHVPIWSGK